MKKLTLLWILIFTFQIFAQNKNVALKFDEFIYFPPKGIDDYADSKVEIIKDVPSKISDYERTIRFAKEVLMREDSKAYIVFYNQRKDRYPLDTGKKETERFVEHIIREKILSRERINVIDGGYRKDPSFEFWVVPPNAEPPKPTPTFSSLEIAVCPSIYVSKGYVEFEKDRNQPLKFSVDVNNGHPNSKTNLEWNVSAGKIIKGQNTNQIEVDVSETEATFISVSVTVKGLHPECNNHKFISIQVGVFRYENMSYKIEKFNEDVYMDLLRRVDVSIFELNSDPTSKGYIFMYGSRNGSKEDVRKIRQYLDDMIQFRKFDKTRLIFIEGGFREEAMVEFSIVPKDAEPPKPTPTLDSQFVVEPKKVVKKRKKVSK